ncbi:MAG TPA: hypothetical protein VKZ44_07965, partial [Taishania sp.]|nr:hypothetical protein [Taishania sp.]
MKKRLLSVVLCTFFSFALSAQIQGYGGDPRSSKISFPKDLPSFNFAQPDIAQLRMEDSITEITKVGPWRFGFNNEVSINLENAGKWYNLPNGGKVWMVRLHCNEALTINLTFENLTIPEGNELYVYNEDKSFILGKFTANHVYEGQLGTELIPGSTAIVEYYVSPKNQGNIGSLTIDKVTHGYRTSSEFANKAFGGSGSCNMNVNCPDGDDWADEKRSVVMLVSGSNGFCTGALVNNTAYDGKPYILTANHCYSSYSNPATWVFRFHWESPTCTNPVSSPTNFQSLSGAILRARRTPSDFCLVEITGGLSNGTIPESMNP